MNDKVHPVIRIMQQELLIPSVDHSADYIERVRSAQNKLALVHDNLCDEIKLLEMNAEYQESRISEQQNQFLDHRKEISRLIDVLAEKNSDISRSDTEIETLNYQKRILSEKVDNLELDLRAAQTGVNSLQLGVQERDEIIQNQIKDIEEHLWTISAQKNSIDAKNILIEELQAQISDLETQLEDQNNGQSGNPDETGANGTENREAGRTKAERS